MRYYTYKVTFKDLPGYFYFGKHKDDGKPYTGTPKTWKHLWDQFEPEVQVLCWYETWEEASRAEDSIIRETWDSHYSLNESVGPKVSLDRLREGGRRAVETLKKEKLGIFDPGNKEILRENGRNNSRRKMELGIGIFDPEVRESDTYKDMLKRNAESSRIRNSVPILCLETSIEYPSAKEAGRKTGIAQSSISRSVRSGGSLGAGGFHWTRIDGDRTS